MKGLNFFLSAILLFAFQKCITLPEGEIVHPVTEDGFPLTLERFKPERITKPYPVILCHGIMATRKYFKMNGNRSIAMALQSEGYDVWLLDLRGRDDAGSPGYFFGDRTYSYNVDNYINQDMDTAISTVLTQTGKTKVNWIGHSMGGMIAYARIGSKNENRVANLVTFGSPFYFHLPNQNMRYWRAGKWFTDLLPVIPTGCIGTLSSYSCVSIIPENYLGEMVWHEPNLPQGMVRKAERFASNNIATGVSDQFADSIEKGRFHSADGSKDYTKDLKNIKIPALLIAGRRDNLAPAFTIREIYEQIGSEDKSIFIAGRTEGSAEDYGHTDLFLGSGAYEEIILPVIRWLNQRNGNINE